MPRATKKHPKRRVEVFVSQEDALDETKVVGVWKPIKFHKLRKGDIFRCFDTTDGGKEVPDQTSSGQHVVQVALKDAEKMKAPELGVIQCLPVRGFNKEM